MSAIGEIYNCKGKHLKKYEKYDIEKIVYKAQNGDSLAEEYLIKNFIGLVYNKIKNYFLPNGDKNDLLQVGLGGLAEAIRDYSFDSNASFRSFASLCIRRKIITQVKKSNRKKHSIANQSISYNKKLSYNDEEGRTLIEVLDLDNGIDSNPLSVIVDKHSYNEIKTYISKELTNLEFQVLKRILVGKTYKETAKEINRNKKSVDNALQRIRKKLEEFLNKREEGVC